MPALAHLFAWLALLSPDCHEELPPLSDLHRFLVSRPQAQAFRGMSYAYQAFARNRQLLEPRHYWQWEAAIEDAAWCLGVWDCLEDALMAQPYGGGEDESPSADEHSLWRRRRLAELRRLLGDEAYRMGRLPPPVPTWRLSWAE